jgi:hypothetical protein
LGNEVGFAYQSPPPLYFSKAISWENPREVINKQSNIIFFINLKSKIVVD